MKVLSGSFTYVLHEMLKTTEKLVLDWVNESWGIEAKYLWSGNYLNCCLTNSI